MGGLWQRIAIAGMLIAGLAGCAGGVAPPTPSPAPTAIPTAAPTQPPVPTPTVSAPDEAEIQDFAPKQRAIWDTKVDPGQTIGQCSGGPALPAYGLVQITPLADGLEWKNQEPAPYRMTRLGPNTYQFVGPTAINDGVVTMTVTFLSAQALKMVREFTPQAEPGCVHRHEYTGMFKWFR
jgi:hypothetical protein